MRTLLACRRALALTTLVLVTVPVAAGDLSQPGPLVPARRDVTVARADGSTFAATVHYPGITGSVGAPVDPSQGPYSIVAFGHGFLCPVALYASTSAHLASWGMIVILPQTQGSILPNHAALAADMLASLEWLAAEGGVPGSPWEGCVDGARRGVMGHSMGGGCSLLAAKADPRVRVAVPMAAADTTPSATAAALDVRCATRLIVGSQDTIVPPSSTAGMYPNLAGPAQLVSISGGFHCGFMDSSIVFCDSGSITRAQQLGIVRRETTEFLRLYLVGDASLWSSVWDAPAPGAGVTQQGRQTPDLDGDGHVSGADLGILLAHWGGSGRGDLNADGAVNGADLGALLAAWTG